jgi:hypothetical protein
MLIGVDLDNTVLDHRTSLLAISRLMGFENFEPTKKNLKKAIVEKYGEAHWTFTQALIYGPLSMEAEVYSGVHDFLARMDELGHKVCIVSHRTKEAAGDARIDLQNYGRLAVNRLLGEFSSRCALYTESSIEEKVRTIKKLRCDVFVDDLQHVLEQLQQTGSSAVKILFGDPVDPVGDRRPALGARDSGLYAAHSWIDVKRIVETLS